MNPKHNLGEMLQPIYRLLIGVNGKIKFADISMNYKVNWGVPIENRQIMK